MNLALILLKFRDISQDLKSIDSIVNEEIKRLKAEIKEMN